MEAVVLRKLTEADLPALFEHQADPVASRMAAFPSRSREAFFAHWREKVLGSQSGWKRAVVVDGEVAGNVLCWEEEGRWLVGYWLGRKWWGRGVATQALRLFLEEVPERPLYAHVAATNLGSIRVLEKCGFVREGGVVEGPDGVDDYVFRLDA